MTLPAAGTFEIPTGAATFTNSDFSVAQEAFLATVKQLLGASRSVQKMISSGVITPTTAIVDVRNEGGAPSDNLDTIQATNMERGAFLLLHAGGSASKPLTIRHQVGNISLAGGEDVVIQSPRQYMLFYLAGKNWDEVALLRSWGHVRDGRGSYNFTSSGNFTVPDGVSKLWVTLIAGGGGGGGGAGADTGGFYQGQQGSDGVDGNLTSITTSKGFLSSAGGVAGLGAFSDGRPGFGFPSGTTFVNFFGGYGGQKDPPPINGVYGRGGRGGGGVNGWAPTTVPGSGGGAGEHGRSRIKFYIANVTPGEVCPVVIGAGGAGGAGGVGDFASGDTGQDGQNGYLTIEY